MEIKVTIEQRTGDSFADAIFDGKCMTVMSGKISEDFAAHIQGGKKAKSYRENSEYVNEDREIIKPCVFNSPSTAAQFVTGRSINGYVAWKVEKKKSLSDYLKENGLR